MRCGNRRWPPRADREPAQTGAEAGGKQQNAPNQAETTEALQSALNWLTERKESQTRSEQYQKVIDDFPKMTQELRRQLVLESNKILPNGDDLPAAELEQQILQTSSLLLEQARLLQQEQDRTREISDSLGQLPQQQTDARRALTEVQRRLQAQPANPTTPYAQAARPCCRPKPRRAKPKWTSWSWRSCRPTTVSWRACAQRSIKAPREIDVQLQALRNNLNAQRQREAELALEKPSSWPSRTATCQKHQPTAADQPRIVRRAEQPGSAWI